MWEETPVLTAAPARMSIVLCPRDSPQKGPSGAQGHSGSHVEFHVSRADP